MKSMLWIGGVALLVGIGFNLSGCGTKEQAGDDEQPPAETAAPAEAVAPPLAGTQWQLVEIQSMSDEVGIERPEDPALYTLAFGEDGQASLRLNCNQGTGTWTSEASSQGGGSLQFGPIAATRASCPPPSLDERIARDLEFVRSYTLESGRLHLSLMADGGIYVWEPLVAVEEE